MALIKGLWLDFADWRRHAAYLTQEEKGSLIDLMIAAAERDGRLQNDQTFLKFVAKLSTRGWRNFFPKFAEIFKQSDDGCWRHETIDFQLERAERKREVRQEAGKAGAEARRQKQSQAGGKPIANATANDADLLPDGMANATLNNESMNLSEPNGSLEIDSSPSLRSVEESTRPPPASPRSARTAKIKFWKRAEALVGDKGAVGRQLSEVGEQKVEEALNAVERTKPHEPIAFFVACCQGRTPETPQPDRTYAGPSEPLSEEALERIRLRIRNREEIPHAGTSQVG